MKGWFMKVIGAVLTIGFAVLNAGAQVTLKDAFQRDFVIGAALNPSVFCESNAASVALVKKQFNSISPENVLKWEFVHPEPDKFDFSLGDRYVEFGVKNKMVIIGHNLIWHSQTPRWVFEDANGKRLERDALLARMREHIFTVVGRYKGKIKGWDVVNEALAEDGELRNSRWRRIIGDDFLVKAYQFAHEADPQAELYYNDYSIENEPKRNGAIALIKNLQAQGVKITAVGIQGHYHLDTPTTDEVDKTISAFSKLGVKVMITELDVNVLPSAGPSNEADVSLNFAPGAGSNPYTNGLPDSVERQLAQRYADLFTVFVAHRSDITRVTFWGVTDGDSWLNDWPVRGRTDYPLLFGRDGNPKPAFDAVIRTAREQMARSAQTP
jgi:endo-1,4-beta-xylanase